MGQRAGVISPLEAKGQTSRRPWGPPQGGIPSCRSGDGAGWGPALHAGETLMPVRENESRGAHGTSPGWQKVRVLERDPVLSGSCWR